MERSDQHHPKSIWLRLSALFAIGLILLGNIGIIEILSGGKLSPFIQMGIQGCLILFVGSMAFYLFVFFLKKLGVTR